MIPGDGFAVAPGSTVATEVLSQGYTSRVLLGGYSFCYDRRDLPICVPDLDLTQGDATVNATWFNFTQDRARGVWVLSGGIRRKLILANASATTELAFGDPATLFSLADVGAQSVTSPADTFITWAWGFPGGSAMGTHTTAMSGSIRVNLFTGALVVRFLCVSSYLEKKTFSCMCA